MYYIYFMETQINMKKNFINFTPITKVLDYTPAKYFENWDGSFNKIKIGKTNYFRPNKEVSNFTLKIKENNPLNLKSSSKGIYVLVDTNLKYFYIGKTLSNIKQRLSSHIQKLTSTNNNRNTTPKKWQKISYERYKKLREDSVNLNDLIINFYHLSNYSSLSLSELENFKYKEYKNNFSDYIFLNDPKAL